MADSEAKCKEWEPTPQQKKMAELLANPTDTRTKEEKCNEVKVAPSTLWRWEQIREFRDFVNSVLDKYTDTALPQAWRCLIGRMENDTQAIKLYFEMKNLYKDRKEIAGNDGKPFEVNIKIVE